MKSALAVWWDGGVVGELRLDEHGDMSFVYAAEWLEQPDRRPISVSLPKQPEPFTRRQCRPFFAGLLPEEEMRDNAARALGVSKANDYALLDRLGGDVAGALTLWPIGEQPPIYDGTTATEPLGENALIELLDTLPRRPLLAGQEGLRLSLAGAQAKLPVVLIDGRVALPVPGQPTTHILKPPISRFRGTTENEAFVMRLAREAGLSVATAEPRIAKDRPYLLVTRYDRTVDAAGQVHRVHQEDFCQALGIPPEHKYADERGPTFKTSFALLRKAATLPASEIIKLLDAAIFNLVAGNADAHGKNFSLLYSADRTTLAPLYDLMCTAIYPEISAKPAMKIAGASSLDELSPRTWEKFARDIEFGLPLIRRRVTDLTERVRKELAPITEEFAAQGIDRETVSAVATTIDTRAKTVGASVA